MLGKTLEERRLALPLLLRAFSTDLPFAGGQSCCGSHQLLREPNAAVAPTGAAGVHHSGGRTLRQRAHLAINHFLDRFGIMGISLGAIEGYAGLVVALRLIHYWAT